MAHSTGLRGSPRQRGSQAGRQAVSDRRPPAGYLLGDARDGQRYDAGTVTSMIENWRENRP